MAADPPAAFFSYCREDSDFALRLAADLKAARATVWIDQLDIEPGMPWDREVEDALARCARLLVILSPVSVKSDNVGDEVSFALSRQKRVIPVLYRECDIPFRLARLQHIDFRADYARGLKLLLKVLGAEPAPPPITSAPPVALQKSPPPVEHVIELHPTAEQQEGERRPVQQPHLEEERSAAPVLPGLPIVPPTLRKAAFMVGAFIVVVAVLIGYWATRPGVPKAEPPKPEVKTETSSPPPAVESSSTSAGAERPPGEKTAADKASAGKAAAGRAAPAKTAPEKPDAVKQPATESLSPQGMDQKGDDYRLGRGVTKDDQQAVIWYRKAAEAGSPEGMYELGWMYKNGNGVDKDYKQAVTWFRKAAEAGDAHGMNNLGWMYRDGYGVDKDYKQAVTWFRKAAEAGNPNGMYNVGFMYENGYGVEKDNQQAVSWYRKASQLGRQDAKDALKRLGESP